MNTLVSLEIDKLLLKKDINMRVSPTIADVVMLLYKNHGIWIEVSYMDDVLRFGFNICTIETNTVEDEQWKFTSPTEAYEAAIIYTLKNLI